MSLKDQKLWINLVLEQMVIPMALALLVTFVRSKELPCLINLLLNTITMKMGILCPKEKVSVMFTIL